MYTKDNSTGHIEWKKEEEAGKRKGGQIIIKSGHNWTASSTRAAGKGLLQSNLWCPNNLARLHGERNLTL